MRARAAFSLLLLVGWARAQSVDGGPAEGACAIDVEVAGLKPGGNVWVILFDDPKAFPTRRDLARARIDAEPSDGGVKVAFERLPCGVDYAVAVVHDENSNGKLDTGLFHIPNEGLGSSRNAKGFMGPPHFPDAKVRLSAGRMTLPIQIKY